VEIYFLLDQPSAVQQNKIKDYNKIFTLSIVFSEAPQDVIFVQLILKDSGVSIHVAQNKVFFLKFTLQIF